MLLCRGFAARWQGLSEALVDALLLVLVFWSKPKMWGLCRELIQDNALLVVLQGKFHGTTCG